MRRVLATIGCMSLLLFVFCAPPAHAADSDSYSATVSMSDGTTCDLWAYLSGTGSVEAFLEIDCDSAVYRLTGGNPTSADQPLLIESLAGVGTRSTGLGISTQNNDSYLSDSATISPQLDLSSYEFRHIAFHIVGGSGRTFTSYPSECAASTHPSSGYQRLICTPAALQF